ncbi:MAG: putative lipid II flippase FtsW [Candidatus Omnitrophota bacterium]|nr:MAG: putative lipid II flippase FtsW [Candidatus Omnitrophota bacterium]
MKVIKNERRFIFVAVLALTLFGALMVYESSSLYAYKSTLDAAFFFKKQFIFFLVGLGMFFSMLFLDLEFLRKYNKEFLVSILIILVLILFIGKRAGGARRWFHLPGFNFQPSEMLKIFFLLYCADYFSRKDNLIKNFRAGLVPLGIVLGAVCLLLILQPDLGTALFLVVWTLLCLFLYGARRKHLLFIIVLGIIAAVFLIKFYPYRSRRILAYCNPFSDPKGAGFQAVQSQIAYGEGGILGVGFGASRQKLFFLPAAHTDFIFSIIAEEFGLWGALSVLCAFFIVFHKMGNIARGEYNKFKRGILWGVVFIFSLEVVINIGVSCGLLPITGLPLPFISYGGSNLISHYILLGLFFNASRGELAHSS